MENSRYNIKLVQAFAQRAVIDLKDAGILLDSGDYSGAAYFAQQSSEKIVKCILVINNKFEKTHFVSKLLKEVIVNIEKVWKNRMEGLIPLLDDLEEHGISPLYPEPHGDNVWNPIEEYTEKDAKDALEKAKIVLKTISDFMKKYYSIEFNTHKEEATKNEK